MPTNVIVSLRDNYDDAVKSGRFARDFDPARPEVGFLPPDLFDSGGPWVEIGESGLGVVAPIHVQALSGRSAFRVFIRCPGGRSATHAYLEALNLHRTPWATGPAQIWVREPEGRRVRGDPDLDLATPQFPAGTMVAIVRKMAAINDRLQPVVTPITQSVQFRIFRKVNGRGIGARFSDTQFAYEFSLRRRDLLAGMSGGLHPVKPEDEEFQIIGGLLGERAVRLRGSPILSTCAHCHSARGIFSVNSYTRMFGPETTNPRLLPADDPGHQGLATVEWKKRQFDWGLLRGLLASKP
jgi:hypothetical protein